ncbi:MAG: DUF1800 family protein [Singulisphaera sp.]
MAACDAQGQELFSPPNVGGWEGQDGSTAPRPPCRGNWVADVVWGRPENGLAQFDPLAWAARNGLTAARAGEEFVELLLQDDLKGEARAAVVHAGKDADPDGLRTAVQLILNCPEYQLA